MVSKRAERELNEVHSNSENLMQIMPTPPSPHTSTLVRCRTIRFLLSLLLLGAGSAALSAPFSYQGRLSEVGRPADGPFDLRFSLFGVSEGGTERGVIVVEDLAVEEGRFTTWLDFGEGVFDGSEVWLQVAVRPGGSEGGFTILEPRQRIGATPYAQFALAGNPGPKGEQGDTGPPGPEGPQGDEGPLGETGVVGPVGPQGETGPVGPQGVSGPLGPQGLKGDPGVMGPVGPAGPKGDPGVTGNPGPAGPQGGSGANGVSIRWLGSLTETPAQPSLNEAYYSLADGAAYVHDGTVWQTLAQDGQDGSDGAAGPAGPLGPKGDMGTAGTIGPIGPQGPQGLKGVQGDVGPIGPAGPQGPPGSADAWGRTGNAGTTAGVSFLGTIDEEPLEVHVNGERALRIEPGTVEGLGFAPNIISGASSNSVGDNVLGATIGGGGATLAPNQVDRSFGTVGGGYGNTASGRQSNVGGGAFNAASGKASTVGGGELNTASGSQSTVGGGSQNTASGLYSAMGGGKSNTASGYVSTVAGGEHNTASISHSTVGGGHFNQAGGYASTVGGGQNNTASGSTSTVPGGARNTAQGSYSLAAGYRAKVYSQGTFMWADSQNEDFSSPASGDDRFLIRARGGVGIGTAFPSHQLSVSDNNHQIALMDRDNTNPVTGQKTWTLTTIQSNSGFGIYEEETNLDRTLVGRLVIESGGNVGIGTSNPAHKLSVNGSAGKSTGGSWSTFSDARLKDVVVDFKRGLADLEKLQPVRYRYKTDNPIGLESEYEHIGFVAQEVQRTIPEAVNQPEGSDYLEVNNDPILWTMLNGIKELSTVQRERNAEIEKLKAENTKLRQDVEELKHVVGSLLGQTAQAAR